MQINGPHPSIAPQRPLARPAAEPRDAVPATTVGASASTSDGGGAAGGSQIVDASTIMANWGTSNPLADLNVDGIVDAQDLALVLEGSGGTASGDASAWNAAAGGDLNGDGTVDAHDLALSLNGQAPATPTDASTDSSTEAWTTATGGDLNGDGTVDAHDLALSLNGQTPATPVDPWTATAGGDHNGDGTVDAQDLAAQLNGMAGGAAAADANPSPSIAKLVDLAFAARDGNGDGLLSAKDFGDTGDRLFRFLDLDGNGLAGREEVTKALGAQLDRARSLVPDLSEQAFAKRWLEALAGTRPTPNLGVLARVQQAFVRGDAAPAALPSSILSARA
ncbi:MAG: Dockerin type domain [Planctomycetota bacterium]